MNRIVPNFVSNHSSESSLQTRFIQEPLSEKDIFYLQDTILNNGQHYINVDNIAAGRSILNTFLNILPIYHDIACITLQHGILLPSHITDIYQELMDNHYIDSFGAYDLEAFFCNRFYFDFMWIEATENLIDTEWFAQFDQKMKDFLVKQQIPIITLSYKNLKN